MSLWVQVASGQWQLIVSVGVNSAVQAMEDATGSLWAKGALRNKPAGLFTSTATQGGGQEVTCMSGTPPSRSLLVIRSARLCARS